MNDKKRKEDILESISDAVNAIRTDITSDVDANKNKIRAEAILALTVAYNMIKCR